MHANKTTEVDLTMGRFIGVPGAPRQNQTWTLPVCIQAAAGQPRCEVMERPKQTVRLNGCSSTASGTDGNPIFVNADSRGYYFTEYRPTWFSALARSASTLDAVERLGLIGDEWWMVRGGRHDVGVYLDRRQRICQRQRERRDRHVGRTGWRSLETTSCRQPISLPIRPGFG